MSTISTRNRRGTRSAPQGSDTGEGKATKRKKATANHTVEQRQQESPTTTNTRNEEMPSQNPDPCTPITTGGINHGTGTPNSTEQTTRTLASDVNPPHEVTPTTNEMPAVVDLTNKDAKQAKADYRSSVKSRMLLAVWPKVKFLDYDSPQGQRAKQYMLTQLRVTHYLRTFAEPWPPLKRDMNEVLRHQRAYVTQQIKSRVFGTSYQGIQRCHCKFISPSDHLPHTLTESLALVDRLPENDPNKRYFSRMDFLVFDPPSVLSEGNKERFRQLQKLSQNDEDQKRKWEGVPVVADWWKIWKDFPNFDNTEVAISSLKDQEGSGVRLLAWLVGTFSDVVTHCKLKEGGERKHDPNDRFSSMTLDDFVFLFVQVQHNIDYWTLCYRAHKEKTYIDEWKLKDSVEECPSDKKSLTPEDYSKILLLRKIGFEYPTGSGVAGTDGKKRYVEMTKFLYRAYYTKDNPTVVSENRQALKQALKEYAQWSESNSCSWGGSNDTADDESTRANKKARVDEGPDSELEKIQLEQWNDFGNDVVAV